jgi:hypothetical protein
MQEIKINGDDKEALNFGDLFVTVPLKQISTGYCQLL